MPTPINFIPQMKPMNWMFLLVYINLCFFCYSCYLIYPMKINQTTFKKKLNLKQTKNMFKW